MDDGLCQIVNTATWAIVCRSAGFFCRIGHYLRFFEGVTRVRGDFRHGHREIFTNFAV